MESDIKKICIFNGNMSRGGGTEKISAVLGNLLAENTGWAIYIVSLNNETNQSFFPLSSRVRHISLRSKGIPKKIFELRKFLKKEKIRVIVDVDIMLAVYSIPATFFTKTKIVSWEMFNIRNDIGSRHTGTVRKLCLRYSAYYVTQTKGDMQAFQNEMPVKCLLTFVHNPCEKPDVQPQYDLTSKTLMTAGHFFFTKGYDLAIEAARFVFDRHPDWRWNFYGDGPECEKCKEKVKEYALENNVIFCGRKKNITDEYKKASIYVMTSRTEGFGLVLTEAKAQSLPTVAFDCEFGPREIIEDNVSGYLVPAFDVSQMADKICFLIETENKRALFARHAGDNLNKFSAESFLRKWIDILSVC
ncbi:MAG: glycosyltransferase family 4 protein [Clostridiales bacterium]|nr:glycosyltransferase family 4 protein [Clostridiales bacterium]